MRQWSFAVVVATVLAGLTFPAPVRAAQVCLNTQNNEDVPLGETVCAWGWWSRCEKLGQMDSYGLIQTVPHTRCKAQQQTQQTSPKAGKTKREALGRLKPKKPQTPAPSDLRDALADTEPAGARDQVCGGLVQHWYAESDKLGHCHMTEDCHNWLTYMCNEKAKVLRQCPAARRTWPATRFDSYLHGHARALRIAC